MAKIFIQTLCVSSQMKDTKHIRGDFHSVAWVMPQGFDFGVLGVPRGSKKIKNAKHNASKNVHPKVKLTTLGRGQISLNFGYHVKFLDFYTKFCVGSYKYSEPL